MKKLITILIAVLLTSSCELPWQRDADRSDPYGDVVRTVSPGGNVGDFARTLNDLMSGPTNGMNCSGAPRGSEEPTFKLGPIRHAETIKNKFGDKEEVVKWNECGGDMTASYTYNSGGRLKPISCTKRKINKEFYNFFETNFSKCSIEAFASLKGKDLANSVDKITFLHEGIAGDKRHRRKGKSLHNVYRAIDIPLFEIHSEGKKYSFNVRNQTIQPEKRFFDNFRKCWSRKVKAYNPNCASDTDPMHGSRGYEDGVHTKHLHISLPYCKGGGYWRKIALQDSGLDANHDFSHEGHNH